MALVACAFAFAIATHVTTVRSYQNTFFGAQRPFSGQPVGPVTSPTIACLSTTADEVFGPDYTMRCPSSANITDFVDKTGTQHRLIRHAPLKGVTAAMMRWFWSPGLAIAHPLVQFRGSFIYWYKLWHPVDHGWLLPYAAPNPDVPFIPSLYVDVKESYRPAPEELRQQGYDLHACVYVADTRFTIQFRAPGGVVIAALLNHPWVDSPDGLLFTSELIVGLSAPAGVGRVVNKVAVQPVVLNQFPGLVDQITRHHVEEMGNMEQFLPEIWARYAKLGRVAAAVAGGVAGPSN